MVNRCVVLVEQSDIKLLKPRAFVVPIDSFKLLAGQMLQLEAQMAIKQYQETQEKKVATGHMKILPG